MTSRTMTMIGYALLGLAALVCQRRARRPGARWLSFGDVLTRAMADPHARLVIAVAWLWLGYHVLTP
jgi:Family of unknown function (DUF6186)